jgi:hypothetical protein
MRALNLLRTSLWSSSMRSHSTFISKHLCTANISRIKLGNLKHVGLIATFALITACGGGGGSGGGNTNNNTSGSNNGGLVSNAPITAKISGKVLDKSGQPVSGVTISAFHHNDHTTLTATTDANGNYSIAGLTTVTNADYGIYAEKAGFGIYPTSGDKDGVVGKMDFNGLYRTLIRFISMPAHDVTSANFTIYRAGDKMASLPRTGQKISYLQGDDYTDQKGVAWPDQRFTDNLDGTVTDHLSGLIWLKNAGCFESTDWATALADANKLASGSCGLTDNSSAGQWRMPNANELESLVDVSQVNPAISANSPFTQVNLTQAYWSSTTYTALPSSAMAIRFTDGRWINGIDIGDNTFNNDKKNSSNAVWAVKSGAAGAVQLLATGAFAGPSGGGSGQSFGDADDAILQMGAPLTSPRFIDNGNGTLSDTVTGLTWLKQADCVKQTWSVAIAMIKDLANGQCGLSDGSSAGQWRMPNRTEMLSLSDRAPTFPQASYFNGQYQASDTLTGPIIFNNFIVSDYYWTSTTDAADPSQAWTLYSCDFGVYNIAKTDIRLALAVR